MTCLRPLLWAVVCSVPLLSRASDISRYEGLCDASAAVALDAEHFVVADDERNVLVTYRRGRAGPVAQLDLHTFLGTAADQESDLEGSARLGGRIYWIASHGRNKNGKARPERQRLFATQIQPGTQPPTLRPVGQPSARLLDDLAQAPALAPYRLRDAAQRAPEAPGGLNIEGLAATADGGLLIGLRSPRVAGRALKALLVPLNNPAAVVDSGAPARFGPPIELDLGGRGVRSIERVQGRYLIVAGPVADQGSFALYSWRGDAKSPPVQLTQVDFRTLNPEALFEWPGTGELQVLSDDGGLRSAGVACKALPRGLQGFRGMGFSAPAP
jgi:hypothetical protein